MVILRETVVDHGFSSNNTLVKTVTFVCSFVYNYFLSDYLPGYYYTINYCCTEASGNETSLLPIKLTTPEGITLELYKGEIASRKVKNHAHMLDPLMHTC